MLNFNCELKLNINYIVRELVFRNLERIKS